MKILICVWRLTHGGAERVASMWAKGFAQQGHAVDFLLGSYSSPITYDIPANSKLYYECAINDKIAVRLVPNFWKKRKVKRIISKVSPDVIICVLPKWGSKIREAMGKVKNIPIIVTEHNSYERPSSYPMSKDQYERKFKTNRYYDAVTVLTNADMQLLKAKKDEDFTKNTFVLPNPVSFEPLSKVPEKQKILLAAGRLDAWEYKGFDLLIQAWAKIESLHPEWILNIAGDGNKTYLQEMSKKLGVADRVRFLGFVDMKEQYQKSAIFVLSSRYEGFGMVLPEAMSQGCACIACDYKGRQKEIIENNSQGIICPVEDVDSLSHALEKMISDDVYRKSCSINAIERSKFYSVENITDIWNRIFKSLNL